MAVNPLLLPPNWVPRFYRGGPAIAELRGIEPPGDRVPEDWVGSTTTVFGEAELGLSRLSDGRLLRDAIAADPVGFLGPDHAARRGPDPGLLVKLLDAGQRLPVHVHPDDAFARERLGGPVGKTEAWIVVATAGPDAGVAAGFRDDVPAETLERWVREQDHDAMLAALNPIPVTPGDAIFVPAGVAHAIGQGILIVELQQPSDMSVLLEWDGFGVDDEQEATLGLGWDVALRAVDLGRRDAAALRGPGLRGDGAVKRLLPEAADAFFRADRIAPAPIARLDRGFAILVVTEGAGAVLPESGPPLPVRRGDTVLMPWAAGACHLEGDVVAIACRPPRPEAGGLR
ncbi:MAG: mannose-6-phosphate isomerase [Solirubrobacteraceae bacterium]|jgi:mannose-6-phosphate isomerase|nr:mannose-6-phosphate isomerase [Solirubrobacteraceae bacterium]